MNAFTQRIKAPQHGRVEASQPRQRPLPHRRCCAVMARAGCTLAPCGQLSTVRSRVAHSGSSSCRLPILQHTRQQQALHLAPWQQQPCRRRDVRVASTSTLIPLGMDFLTFLSATVLVVPLCKQLKISPVLGFLASGVILEQLGMLKDLRDVEALSELGVLFLLFEQGLELSLDRLKALAKFAFGMGTLQVVGTTLLFTGFALPAGRSWGTVFLEAVAHAPPSLVSIRTVDEAVVIGAALAMSSSAFVLQLLQERGEMPTRVGSATLGILLFQDIAVVPFLVLLPVIEMSGGMEGASPATLLSQLGPTALQTLAGLGALLLGGRIVLRRVFEVVANSRSSETFVALCLLTVGGTSLITKQLGLSDTLGAFIAGVLLAETSFRTQIEADIRPFRGLLIGLFFLSVGSSINMGVLRDNWDIIAYMLVGLVSLKAAVNIALGPLFGLSKAESIRTGFLLSQGGEFAFVLLSLACQLKLLPNDLNQILIITVVCSMALTPALAQAGQLLGDFVEAQAAGGSSSSQVAAQGGADLAEVEDPLVILGFGAQGQMVANMIASPLARAGTTSPLSYLAFDLEHAVVLAARLAGFNILYGDGSRPDVLRAAGVKRPRAIAVCYASASQTTKACEHLHEAFPGVPLYAVAQNFAHATDLRAAGAEHICITGTEAGLNLGASVLSMFGTTETDIQLLKKGIGEAIAVRTTVCADVLKQEQQEQEAAEQQQKQQGLPSNGSSAKAALSRSSSSSSSSTSTSSSSTSSKGLPSLLPPRNGRAPMPAAASSSGSSSSGPSSGSSSKPGVEIFSLEGKWCCGEPQQGGDGSVVTPTVLTVPPSAMKAPSSSNASDAPASSSAAADSSSSSSSSSATVRARPPLAENGRNGKGIMLGVAVEEDMHGVWSMDDPAPRNGSSGSSSSGAAVGTPVAQPVQPVVAAAPVPASTQQPGSQP